MVRDVPGDAEIRDEKERREGSRSPSVRNRLNYWRQLLCFPGVFRLEIGNKRLSEIIVTGAVYQ